MLTSTFLLMRFDEASKIKYVFCCAFVASRAHFSTILETLAFITRDGTDAVAVVLVSLENTIVAAFFSDILR